MFIIVLFRMEFALEKRWWLVKSMTVSYTLANGGPAIANMEFDASFLTAPYDFSYKCVKPGSMLQKNKTVDNVGQLLFSNLQVSISNILFHDNDGFNVG